ncbi:HNH endonuclease [Paenibacillus albilobatus]|uniref:HNH endonuclease n=1 Tax=Paenibacillus albilobatus TaxID=2716884 RepID=UPI001BB36FB6|nr:HNH endonuclease [Paenibacillus albilobatus]
MSKEIFLSQGKIAVVDDEDFDKLIKFKWHYAKGYARHSCWVPGLNTSTSIWMHHVVLGICPDRKKVIDHINGNPLDNRKINLRIVTHQQNIFNKSPHRKSTSKYKGVYWYKARSKWCSKIMLDGRYRHIGYFESEREAALAYNKAAKELFGDCAKLNVV